MEEEPRSVESTHANILRSLGFKAKGKQGSEEIERAVTQLMEMSNMSIQKEAVESRLNMPHFYRTMDGTGTIAVDELGGIWRAGTVEDLARFGFKYYSAADISEALEFTADKLSDFKRKPKN